ncbi:MAG: gamma-glutamyltransferase family protein, partial [Thermomicrobiales bacterium]
AALSRDYFVSRGYEKMPFYGPLSIGVPGAVAAYFHAIERWCRLPALQLFSYAIGYAERGFPVTDKVANAIADAQADLERSPGAAAVFLREGRPIAPGEMLTQPQLAQTLRLLVEEGPREFYEGTLAERLVAGVDEAGGEMARADFTAHKLDVGPPLASTYRGVTVYQTGLPSQGHIVLEELNILECADMGALGHNSADALHLMIEAKKRAFADRNAYSVDPRFGTTPLETMLSKDFAAQRFASIDPNQASSEEVPGAIPEHGGNTTYLCTADADGNMMSFIHSLSSGFGSRVVAGDTGVVMNNRAGRGFSLVENHPNVIAGGKRTMHTLNCYAIAEADEVMLVGGTPGGDKQAQWNMQAITNLIDYGMDVQAAVEAPRWQSFPSSDPIDLPNPYEVRIESRVASETIEDLRRRGHTVNVVGPFAGGGAAFIIARDSESGVLCGGADPRGDGFAAGI